MTDLSIKTILHKIYYRFRNGAKEKIFNINARNVPLKMEKHKKNLIAKQVEKSGQTIEYICDLI